MRLERLRWLVLALLCASTVINYIDRMALAVLLPTLRDELGITASQYGSVTTLFLMAYTAAQLGSGVIIDRLGTRKGFLLFVTAWSLGTALHGVVGSVLALGLLRFFLGLSEAGNWPAGGKAIAEWFPRHRRAFAMGFFDGGSALGAILAQPLVGTLALAWGWRAAFLTIGSLGLLWALAWLVVYRAPGDHHWLSEVDRRTVLLETACAVNGQRAKRSGLRILVRSRKLWGLMSTRLFATPVWWFYVFWLPDVLAKQHGFTLKEIAMFGWIPFLTVDLGKLVGGAASDKLLAAGWSATLGRKIVMAAGAFLMACGVQVASASSPGVALGWVSVVTFGFGVWSANILALHADIFPPDSMATAVGFTGTAASLGGAIFTFTIGRLVDVSGYSPAFLITAVITALALLSLIFVVGKVQAIRMQEA